MTSSLPLLLLGIGKFFSLFEILFSAKELPIDYPRISLRLSLCYESVPLMFHDFWPNFIIWKSSTSNFNWKKILKNEKNGITALFSLFWLFNFIEVGIISGNWSLKPNLWLYSMVLSIIYYILMKVLMKLQLI